MDDVVAVVLARGLGRRMQAAAGGDAAALTTAQRAAADAGAKGLMPITRADGEMRPFLDYVLSGLADAGYEDVGVVVAPDHQVLREHYDGAGRPTRVALTYLVQQEPLGTADAVRAAESFVASRPFIVINSDNLYQPEALAMLRTLQGPGLVAFDRTALIARSHIPADRVQAFALVEADREGLLLDVHEKPTAEEVAALGARAGVSMNCWRFDERIFNACKDVPPSPRGEYEITAAVRLAIARGVAFHALPFSGPVFDLSSRADIRTVEAALAGLEPRP